MNFIPHSVLWPLLLCQSLINSSTAMASKITWTTFDYPPVYMVDESGYGDKVLTELTSCLSNHSARFDKRVTFTRLNSMFHNTKKVTCLPALGGFPGEIKDAIYSNIALVNPSSIIIIRKSDLHKYGSKDGKVSFEKVIKMDLLGAMVKNGTYGKEVAQIIKENPKKVTERSIVNPSTFFKMLLTKRVDYVLGYPTGYYHTIRSLSSKERSNLTFLSISENSPMLYAYSLCTKSEEGQKVITEINKCLNKNSVKLGIASSVRSFVPDELKDQTYKQNIDHIGK